MCETHQQRIKAKYESFVESLETTPPVECQFKPGDVVKFTNEFGVEFDGMIVLGFAKDNEFYGRFIYIAFPGERAYNGCAYWFPHKPEELTPEMKPIKTKPHNSKGLTRPCTAADLIIVTEGVQCGNCLELVTMRDTHNEDNEQ